MSVCHFLLPFSQQSKRTGDLRSALLAESVGGGGYGCNASQYFPSRMLSGDCLQQDAWFAPPPPLRSLARLPRITTHASPERVGTPLLPEYGMSSPSLPTRIDR
jgi:hypothetical protein